MPTKPLLPKLTQAHAPLTHSITATNEAGATEALAIPAERALIVYLDKREIVTLMTLGVCPEWLVLGYLLNQQLIENAHQVESITVDWEGAIEAGVAAVKTRKTHAHDQNKMEPAKDSLAPPLKASHPADIDAHLARRVVTTGCGQGSIYAGLLDDLTKLKLAKLAPAALAQSAVFDILHLIRQQDTTYKSAGSVHGCALFRVDSPDSTPCVTLLQHIEDVGRHNALDTLAGWMALQTTAHQTNAATLPKSSVFVLYTTGRLTSEMILKTAQMDVPVVISRSGITQMGFDVAQQVGLCTIGRALNQRYWCYTGADALLLP